MDRIIAVIRRLVKRDTAVSDIIGTMIMLGVTVSLVGVVAVATMGLNASSVPNAPPLDVGASARPGDTHVTLRHVGGFEYDEGDLFVIVTVNHTVVFEGTLGAAGDTWRTGETRDVTPLSQALAPGDLVDVIIVSRAHSATVATAIVSVPRTISPNAVVAGFTVNASFGDAARIATVKPPSSIWLEAAVAHPEGRKAIKSVTADLSGPGGSPVAHLNDAGLQGDDTAGDGVYSSHHLVGANSTLGTFDITITATAFDGTRVTDVIRLTVTDSYPFYNTALVNQMGFRIMKFAGTGSGDKASVQFKIRTPTDPVTLEGDDWSLRKVYFEYSQFKPGSSKSIDLKHLRVSEDEWWSCAADGNRIKLFQMNNETIPQYRMDRDTLRYYFTLEWWKTNGGNVKHFGTVEASEQDQYFVLRAHDPSREVRINGWPDTFSTCP